MFIAPIYISYTVWKSTLNTQRPLLIIPNIFFFQVFKDVLSPYYVHSIKQDIMGNAQINELWFLSILSLEGESSECLINFRTNTNALRA